MMGGCSLSPLTTRFRDRVLSALRVDAGKWHRDVGMLLRVLDDFVVGKALHAAQRFIDRKHDERHVAGTVVVGHRVAVARRAAFEILRSLLVGVGVAAGLFEMNVNVEGNEFLYVDSVGHVGSGTAISTRADGVAA
jgi:hypothetical protein